MRPRLSQLILLFVAAWIGEAAGTVLTALQPQQHVEIARRHAVAPSSLDTNAITGTEAALQRREALPSGGDNDTSRGKDAKRQGLSKGIHKFQGRVASWMGKSDDATQNNREQNHDPPVPSKVGGFWSKKQPEEAPPTPVLPAFNKRHDETKKRIENAGKGYAQEVASFNVDDWPFPRPPPVFQPSPRPPQKLPIEQPRIQQQSNAKQPNAKQPGGEQTSKESPRGKSPIERRGDENEASAESDGSAENTPASSPGSQPKEGTSASSSPRGKEEKEPVMPVRSGTDASKQLDSPEKLQQKLRGLFAKSGMTFQGPLPVMVHKPRLSPIKEESPESPSSHQSKQASPRQSPHHEQQAEADSSDRPSDSGTRGTSKRQPYVRSEMDRSDEMPSIESLMQRTRDTKKPSPMPQPQGGLQLGRLANKASDNYDVPSSKSSSSKQYNSGPTQNSGMFAPSAPQNGFSMPRQKVKASEALSTEPESKKFFKSGGSPQDTKDSPKSSGNPEPESKKFFKSGGSPQDTKDSPKSSGNPGNGFFMPRQKVKASDVLSTTPENEKAFKSDQSKQMSKESPNANGRHNGFFHSNSQNSGDPDDLPTPPSIAEQLSAGPRHQRSDGSSMSSGKLFQPARFLDDSSSPAKDAQRYEHKGVNGAMPRLDDKESKSLGGSAAGERTSEKENNQHTDHRLAQTEEEFNQGSEERDLPTRGNKKYEPSDTKRPKRSWSPTDLKRSEMLARQERERMRKEQDSKKTNLAKQADALGLSPTQPKDSDQQQTKSGKVLRGLSGHRPTASDMERGNAKSSTEQPSPGLSRERSHSFSFSTKSDDGEKAAKKLFRATSPSSPRFVLPVGEESDREDSLHASEHHSRHSQGSPLQSIDDQSGHGQGILSELKGHGQSKSLPSTKPHAGSGQGMFSDLTGHGQSKSLQSTKHYAGSGQGMFSDLTGHDREDQGQNSPSSIHHGSVKGSDSQQSNKNGKPHHVLGGILHNDKRKDSIQSVHASDSRRSNQNVELQHGLGGILDNDKRQNSIQSVHGSDSRRSNQNEKPHHGLGGIFENHREQNSIQSMGGPDSNIFNRARRNHAAQGGSGASRVDLDRSDKQRSRASPQRDTSEPAEERKPYQDHLDQLAEGFNWRANGGKRGLLGLRRGAASDASPAYRTGVDERQHYARSSKTREYFKPNSPRPEPHEYLDQLREGFKDRMDLSDAGRGGPRHLFQEAADERQKGLNVKDYIKRGGPGFERGRALARKYQSDESKRVANQVKTKHKEKQDFARSQPTKQQDSNGAQSNKQKKPSRKKEKWDKFKGKLGNFWATGGLR